jgi:hypothetical protein
MLPGVNQAVAADERVPPLLVIVLGAPASVNTTLAKRLAAELWLVGLCKDEVG